MFFTPLLKIYPLIQIFDLLMKAMARGICCLASACLLIVGQMSFCLYHFITIYVDYCNSLTFISIAFN